jgi:hypothetical protein
MELIVKTLFGHYGIKGVVNSNGDAYPLGYCHYCGYWFSVIEEATANCEWCKTFVKDPSKFAEQDEYDEDHCCRCGKAWDLIEEEKKHETDNGLMCTECFEWELEKAAIIQRVLLTQ